MVTIGGEPSVLSHESGMPSPSLSGPGHDVVGVVSTVVEVDDEVEVDGEDDDGVGPVLPETVVVDGVVPVPPRTVVVVVVVVVPGPPPGATSSGRAGRVSSAA